MSSPAPQSHNERPHTDEALKARIVELHDHGHTYPQIATILNEQKWLPLKAKKFTACSVGKLFRGTETTKYLSPKQYLESVLRIMEQEHAKVEPDEPFRRPGFPHLARLLKGAGYLTPKGHAHWWPAQVQQLLEGHFDPYYASSSASL